MCVDIHHSTTVIMRVEIKVLSKKMYTKLDSVNV